MPLRRVRVLPFQPTHECVVPKCLANQIMNMNARREKALYRPVPQALIDAKQKHCMNLPTRVGTRYVHSHSETHAAFTHIKAITNAFVVKLVELVTLR